MYVVTLNANGLRSCIKKGLRTWMADVRPDVLCIQETKAQCARLTEEECGLEGYHMYYADAEKPGYSGVAIYTRKPAEQITEGAWDNVWVRQEGRFLLLRYEGVYLMNVYLPSGSSGPARQEIKWEVMQDFSEYLEAWRQQPCIVVGDFNVAHQNIDIKNWKQNQKKSGFLPYERAWVSDTLERGWVDSWRVYAPDEVAYTWWSMRSAARAKNVGWRIDYQWLPKQYAHAISKAYVDGTVLSDHAPYVVHYDHEAFVY